MSIASEITRLQNAKANIKTAIQNKGVTVAETALIDAYPAYITQIVGGDPLESVVPHFKGVSKQAKAHVESLGSGWVHHVVVTDLHYDINQRHSAAIANYLMSTGMFDKLMILGDLCNTNTTGQMANVMSDGWGNYNGNIIFCMGNHDNTNAGQSGYNSMADYHLNLLSNASYASDAASTMYYYYDDSANKIRYIVLNTNSWGNAQATFLTNAVNLDSSWTIFVLAHYNININMHVPMGEYVNLSQAISAEIISIISASTATVGGIVCGHQHVDSVDLTDNKYYQIALTCDRLENHTSPRPSMTAGQMSEQAVTVWSINPTSKTMEFWRIGAYDEYNDVTVDYGNLNYTLGKYTENVGNLGTELIDFTDGTAWTKTFANYTVISATEAEMTQTSSGGSCKYVKTGLNGGKTYYLKASKGDHSYISIWTESLIIVSRSTSDFEGFITLGDNDATLSIQFYSSSSATDKTITASLKILIDSDAVIAPLTVTANGTYEAPEGTDGYNPVVVNVGSTPTGTKTINITANGTITEDVADYANAQITVAVPASGWDSSDIEAGAPSGDVVSTATAIREYAYAGSAITSYTNDSVVYRYGACPQSLFQRARSLTTVSMASMYNMGGNNVFNGCSALTSVSLPAVTTIGQYAFAGCSSLTNIALPSLTNMNNTYAFQNCSSLAIADLGKCPQIKQYAFSGCTALRKLVLRKTDAICTLAQPNANGVGGIYNNPAESTIYVPSALLSEYIAASGWSTLHSAGVTFTAIEGSEYE